MAAEVAVAREVNDTVSGRTFVMALQLGGQRFRHRWMAYGASGGGWQRSFEWRKW
jgi:hypothetical protein